MKRTSLPEVSVRARLNHKLSPNRFPLMSGLMAAIVGHVLGVVFVSPCIAEIVVTADGFVLARNEGDCGANNFIGNYTDLLRNWTGMLSAAGLTTIERMEAESLFAAKIGYFGRTSG
jgi:hypothetical protein